MKYLQKSSYLYLLALLIFFQYCNEGNRSVARNEPSDSAKNSSAEPTYYTSADFPSVKKINTHIHINVFDSTFIKQASADNFRFLTVNVDAHSLPIEQQQEVALRLVKAFPKNVSYATTFSVSNFNSPSWRQQTLEYLKASFDKGAIAVKVWKNIGMELKDRRGKFVMIDNPVFDTIIDFIEKKNITLIGHLGEPKNAWLPVEKMTVANDKRYFSSHPQYHMYLHPEYPSYEDQVNARDHMLKKHPNIRFIGAHLASLEWNVDSLAARLEKFPNMAVDMAARISHLQYQAVNNWQKVHDFFIRYQDRIIYATDEGLNDNASAREASSRAHENWLKHWKFFTSNEKMKAPEVDKEFNGLKLPKEVIDKIYYKNAVKWLPGGGE